MKKEVMLQELELAPGKVIKAHRTDDFWDDDDGEPVELTFVGTTFLKVSGPLWGGKNASIQTGYVFNTDRGKVTLCDLHSWGSSTRSVFGDVFGNCGFQLD